MTVHAPNKKDRRFGLAKLALLFAVLILPTAAAFPRPNSEVPPNNVVVTKALNLFSGVRETRIAFLGRLYRMVPEVQSLASTGRYQMLYQEPMPYGDGQACGVTFADLVGPEHVHWFLGLGINRTPQPQWHDSQYIHLPTSSYPKYVSAEIYNGLDTTALEAQFGPAYIETYGPTNDVCLDPGPKPTQVGHVH